METKQNLRCLYLWLESQRELAAPQEHQEYELVQAENPELNKAQLRRKRSIHRPHKGRDKRFQIEITSWPLLKCLCRMMSFGLTRN